MSANTAHALLAIALAACLGCAAAPAMAKTSDRSQPMTVDAGRQEGTLDDRAPTVLSQGVIIRQGTLDIRSSRAELHSANGDLSRAVLTGSPVVLKQQMDDGTPMTARASKVDYNLRTGRVDSGGEGNGRVRMRIMPKATQSPNGQDEG